MVRKGDFLMTESKTSASNMQQQLKESLKGIIDGLVTNEAFINPLVNSLSDSLAKDLADKLVNNEVFILKLANALTSMSNPPQQQQQPAANPPLTKERLKFEIHEPDSEGKLPEHAFGFIISESMTEDELELTIYDVDPNNVDNFKDITNSVSEVYIEALNDLITDESEDAVHFDINTMYYGIVKFLQ